MPGLSYWERCGDQFSDLGKGSVNLPQMTEQGRREWADLQVTREDDDVLELDYEDDLDIKVLQGF